jgi:predicted nucleic acid-binding protein
MARDALHAAVVVQERLEGIFSFDEDFDGIPGVVRRVPEG